MWHRVIHAKIHKLATDLSANVVIMIRFAANYATKCDYARIDPGAPC